MNFLRIYDLYDSYYFYLKMLYNGDQQEVAKNLSEEDLFFSSFLQEIPNQCLYHLTTS